MKFKYSAFTENTPEMREWLEKIGYKNFYNKYDGDTICTVFDSSYDCRNYKIGKTLFTVYLKMIDPIDCRSNPQLFKAVTAIREDSNYMQWFVCDKFDNYISDNICIHKEGDWLLWDIESSFSKDGIWHKATPEELAEHFKLEEK